MADQNENSQTGPGGARIVGAGEGGLNGDAVRTALGPEPDDDTSGEAEMEALEEEDDAAGEADVTASGAE